MAAGECGVERVADILEPEFLRTVRLLGARNVAELGPDRVRGPATEP
jgi:isopentenyl diphosphate isomerase/L-lactate dehydrogenase-like FMN-dependent dehydrogenase